MLGWLSLLSFFAFFFLFFGGRSLSAGGGCLSLFQVHSLIFLGPPYVFIPRAFTNPMRTLLIWFHKGYKKGLSSHQLTWNQRLPRSGSMLIGGRANLYIYSFGNSIELLSLNSGPEMVS